MAHLFSKIVLQDALKNVSIADIENKIAILMEWNAMYQKGELQKKKETAFEATYSEKLFGTILGYSDVSGGLYTREKHPKNASNGQTCDIGLGYYSSEKNETQAVVELKDAGTSIDRPQQREGNMTPIQQGFKYKPLYNSRWVIVSNYQEIRLYRDTYQDYEVWTLADLVNPANDYEKFRTFYLLLRAASLISDTGESETEKLLAKVRIEQETITKKFYKEYSGLREELMRDIWKNNPTLRNESVITITQRIIDRIVFIHFCEDRLLLPSDKLKENLTRSKEAGFTPWEVLMAYFRGIDKGSEKLGIPDGYNGGLFRDDDDIIKNLKVFDDVITKFIELGRYDFSDEGGQLSVEILGHIFEQSISDLESIRAKIKNPGGESDEKKVSKRKKDGIFYTPAYIVDYIVRNSLGKYLEEHEERIKEVYKLKGDINEKNYRKREIEAYTEYQKILQNVKVLDPACGSGAFLVRVFDYLVDENVRVEKIFKGDTQNLSMAEVDSRAFFPVVLKNNIYGVDLNKESVEITKLSLWLKSAVRGKKLETLDDNIKCGNSLIDDPAVARDKAFNWNTEFADIMANGGFDVIVGNPPYIRPHNLSDSEKVFLWSHYKSASQKTDIYAFFTEKAIDLIKIGGYLSYIMPKTWMSIHSFKSLREYILKNGVLLQIGVLPNKVFEDAIVETAIIVVGKGQNINTTEFRDVIENSVLFVEQNKNYLKNENFNISSKIDNHYFNECIKLGEICEIIVGIATGDDKKYCYFEKKTDLDKQAIRGNNISRYYLNYTGEYIWYNRQQMIIDGNNKPKSSLKMAVGQSSPKMPEDFELSEKIVLQRIAKHFSATIDTNQYYAHTSVIIIKPSSLLQISLKFLVTIINSGLMNYWLHSNSSNISINSGTVKNLPIKKIPLSEQQPFIEKAGLMLSLNRDLQEKSGSFLKNIQAKYSVSKITRKLEKWWELDFAEFLRETKINISLAGQEELMQYFETRRTEVRAIDAEIRKTDAEIDTMVFDLYGLTEEERGIVLGS